jgi:hypothetical protein
MRTLFRTASVVLLGWLACSLNVRAATNVTITVAQGFVGVEGAFVALVGSGATKFAATTNAAGQAVFSGIPDGSYVALASAPGTSSGSVTVTTPTDTTKTIVVNGSGSGFSALNVFGSQVNQIVADGLPGVFYVNTGVIPQIFRTADYGGSWAPVTIASDDKTFGLDTGESWRVSQLTSSGFPGEIAALTRGRVYLSQDFGVTWVGMPLPLAAEAGSRIYWSHPAATGALSMLFFAPRVTAMYFAAIPIGPSSAIPSGFTQMAVSYRASVEDPMAIANGSDTGIFVVGATTASGSPSRNAGDVKLYKVGSTPDGNTDVAVTLNNSQYPGVVPTVATDGITPLAPTNLVGIGLGGPTTAFHSGTTKAPNTLLVYSATSGGASGASMTTCTLGAVLLDCSPTTAMTFRDLSDVATTSRSLSGTTQTVSCGAPAPTTSSSPSQADAPSLYVIPGGCDTGPLLSRQERGFTGRPSTAERQRHGRRGVRRGIQRRI